jgi:ABC-type antimicrobial peptide transport system ATPase subunit
MDILDSVQKDFSIIDKAAKEFVQMLLDDDVRKSIALSAEMSGLKLLRASKVDFSKLESGAVLLGAIPDETYDLMQRFIFGWARTNGISTFSFIKPKIPNDIMNYFPEVTQFENQFMDICKNNAVKAKYHPFVAATSALRFVDAGKHFKFLEPKTGLAITMYHIISGSKTVPYQSGIN